MKERKVKRQLRKVRRIKLQKVCTFAPCYNVLCVAPRGALKENGKATVKEKESEGETAARRVKKNKTTQPFSS